MLNSYLMDGVELKLGRAFFHCKSLQNECRNSVKLCGMRLETDGNSGQNIFRLETNPPNELSLLLGDVIHNLRCALDYTACALVKHRNGDVDVSKVQFPLGDTSKEIPKKEINRLKNIHFDSLKKIEECRKFGGEYLMALQSFSNDDKHRLLVPCAVQSLYCVSKVVDGKFKGFIPDLNDKRNFDSKPLKDGDVIGPIKVVQLGIGFYDKKNSLMLDHNSISQMCTIVSAITQHADKFIMGAI